MSTRNTSWEFTTSIDPDGGWEEAVDSGDGLAELLLGAHHPYDRSDGYAPAPRWGSRHELESRRFNDITDSVPAPRIVRSSGTTRRTAGPARITPPSDAGGRTKRERRVIAVRLTARQLGISASEVRAVVFTSEPPAGTGRTVGLSESQVRRIRSVYATEMQRQRNQLESRSRTTDCPPSLGTWAVDGRTRRRRSGQGASPAVKAPQHVRPAICPSCDQCIRGTVCGCS